AAFHDGHAGVGRSEVDTDNFRHILCPPILCFDKDAQHLYRVFCTALHRTRVARTFVPREEFFATYTPPQKMI
ncbi:MAG: hypothetical protein IJA73_04270, partial [Oscillospiraceae bacterium]|nr:hypothetical protein [Oscillospiraceae bacterium]